MCIRDSDALALLVAQPAKRLAQAAGGQHVQAVGRLVQDDVCLLYTSDAADERSSVDLGGRRIIKKKKKECTRSI